MQQLLRAQMHKARVTTAAYLILGNQPTDAQLAHFGARQARTSEVKRLLRTKLAAGKTEHSPRDFQLYNKAIQGI